MGGWEKVGEVEHNPNSQNENDNTKTRVDNNLRDGERKVPKCHKVLLSLWEEG